MLHSNREYIDLMTVNHPERVWFTELFGPLLGLEEEWRAQGATDSMLDMTAFGFDYVLSHGVGNTGALHGQPPVTLFEDEKTFVGTDFLGRRVRLDKRTATIPLPETFPVTDMDSWRKIRPMFLYEEGRVSEEEIDRAIELQKRGSVALTSFYGGYDLLRELMGDEGACLAFYDDPELVQDILDTVSDTAVRVFERIADRMTVDQVCIHEDMAGKTGPLIGPGLVREFLNPYYKKCLAPLLASGTKLVCQDSDGNMNPLIEPFMEAGVNVFLPLEPAAGMDPVALRQKYGHRLAFKGGIDKHVLRKSRAEIDRELEYKLQPAMLDSGAVFGLDHRIPNGTPLENYIYYIDRARELLNLPDFRTEAPGWSRMAF